MARSLASDPLRNFKYHVNIPHRTIDNRQVTEGTKWNTFGFMQVSGLAASTEPIVYREGGDNTTPRKMPGQTDFPPLVFTHGMFPGMWNEWYWFKEIFFVNYGAGYGSPGNDFRTDLIINIFDHPVNNTAVFLGAGEVKVSIKVFSAWIQGLAYSDLDAGANGVMIESMTVMHEGFDMKWASGEPGSVANVFVN